MRLLSALKLDIRFQIKQGVYFVYAFLTFAYMILLSFIPASIKAVVVPIVIFTDPSVIGFFFLGAVIMLEKNQGVIQYILVTPLRMKEYVLAKLISYIVASEIASFIIVLFTYGTGFNWFLFFIGILLTSVFFTLIGFIATINCKTLNQYFIKMIPLMIIGVAPCLGILRPDLVWLNIFPGLATFNLVFGAFNTLDTMILIGDFFMALAANVVLYKYVLKKFTEDAYSEGV